MSKCSVIDNKVVLCESLSRSLDNKIVKVVQFFDKTMNPTNEYVVLFSGNKERRKKGVVLNFCPFCSGKLYNESKVVTMQD